ncbi:MAG TPA: aminotransferase class I/II-fold pyridoxal phosphate-dependent enzyme [Candidatus Polarisedimenticolaceae bacterium]|nr:aminotransferase class I/II-fold pyridoxal phosphate-dependent enzyme [Candidatus Polarisedimenticolaceae bacterium]
MGNHRQRGLDVNLNLNVRGMTPSATVAINERCDALIREGRPVYKLGLGQSPFPVPDPVVEELRAHAFQKDYLPVKGLWRLRRAVADYHRRTNGLTSTWQDVLIGPGSKELMFLLQLVYYGDLVIPRPSWVSYAPQARIIGRQVRWLDTRRENNWRMMPADLERLCVEDPDRPRVVIVNYPSNPTGATYSTERLRELAQVARRFRVVLLSDEIYGELHHKGQHVSLGRYYPEGTIVSSGLSKWCGAGGWRLGTFTFPPALGWLRDAMAAVASETFTSTSAPIQYAAVRAFQGGTEIERYLWRSRKILGALGRWAAKRLAAAGVDVHPPAGAFYLFPDFSAFASRLAERGITDSRGLCERLLEDAGVALLPGSDFGRPESELTARLAYVDFDGARALAALEAETQAGPLDDSFLRSHCARILEAIDRVTEWLGVERAARAAGAERGSDSQSEPSERDPAARPDDLRSRGQGRA